MIFTTGLLSSSWALVPINLILEYRMNTDENMRVRASQKKEINEKMQIGLLLREARDEADRGKRHNLFINALSRARKHGAVDLEVEALSLAVLFNIGTGDVRQLVGLFWPYFAELKETVLGLGDQSQKHLHLWAAERILYFAPEFHEIPLHEVEKAMEGWLAAIDARGGYGRQGFLRLRLHHSLRFGLLAKSSSLMRALEAVEPESALSPSPGRLPGEVSEDDGGGGQAVAFGCTAYANQLRVLYHCSAGNAHAAWRCARYLVEGRSACDLALCAVAPREALATLLEPLSRAGMVQEAAGAHARGLSMVLGAPEVSGFFGHHLRYMVRTGAHAQARIHLDTVLAPSGETRSLKCTPFHRFHFLRGAIAVLRLDEKDAQRVTVLVQEASVLAQKFDERNGGNAFEQMLAGDTN